MNFKGGKASDARLPATSSEVKTAFYLPSFLIPKMKEMGISSAL
jgi:hypothetical protein